jgi:hypothetical protein
MTSIMMLGDSWACGEWGQSNHGLGQEPHYRNTHTGTQQYLQQAGHRVINMAEQGASNWSQLDRISPHHALSHNLRDADVVLWFITDPLRDTQDPQPGTFKDLHRTQTQLLTDSMNKLASLVGDREVWLVGGVGVVPAWVKTRHPGWRVIVPDLLRWLVPDSEVSAMHLNRTWRYGDCDTALLDHFEIEEQRVASFQWRAEHRRDSDEHRLFWPDGSHPNREAHRLLTEELILPWL